MLTVQDTRQMVLGNIGTYSRAGVAHCSARDRLQDAQGTVPSHIRHQLGGILVQAINLCSCATGAEHFSDTLAFGTACGTQS